MTRRRYRGPGEKAGMPQNPRTTDAGACTSLGLIQLAVPVEEVAPALMQVARRKAAAVLLQFLRRRLGRKALQQQARFTQQLVALEQVARAAGGDDVGPRRAPAARLRH